jgi:hypothetical protein
MANPLRGEVEFVQGGQRYTLHLGVNALCMAEALLGRKTHEISAALGARGDMSALRGMLWAGLKEHHDLSLEDAGALLQARGIQKATEDMIRALKLAFPEPKVVTARPRKAARGTGSNSLTDG